MDRDPADMVHLKLRFREQLRRQLEEAAQQSGRSLNSELVARLERSFREDEALGAPAQAEFLRTLRAVMDRVSQDMGAGWLDDEDAWKIVRATALYLFSEAQPMGQYLPPLPESEEMQPAFARHREEYERWFECMSDSVRRQTELHIKRESHGLTEGEEREYARVSEEAGKPQPMPDLPEDQLAIWRLHRDRQALIKKATAGAVAVLPRGFFADDL